MADAGNSSAFDETIESPVAALTKPPARPRAPMALVEGSTAHLSADTQSTLRQRLRISSLLMFAGFLAFLIRGVFVLDNYLAVFGATVFSLHVAAVVVTGALGFSLCRRCVISLLKLRVSELLIFGCPALLFIAMQRAELRHGAENGYLSAVVGPWLMLIFTYALFIPNTWRRAAAVVGAMAAAPILVSIYVAATSPAFAALVRSEEFESYFFRMPMIMTLAAVSATIGVHTIGSLRRQAFEAKQLGQYRLKEPIGSGGMGDVYLAEHQLLKRACAIKLIRPEKAGDPRVLARFEREVRSTAKLTHWNTVEIFDYGQADDGTFYYVMEYLPGHSVQELVRRHGPLPPERAIYLLSQACDALAEAHCHGLIHRDIKPGNLFAAHRGGMYDVTKLLDFGLVKTMIGDVQSSDLTQEGTITGSPLYMSPEQAMGDDVDDPRSDIYSLGAVAYFMLTGRPPFDGDKPMRIMMDHVRTPPTPPSELVAELPLDLESVVMRCLAKEPADRFESAAALREALLDCEAAPLWDRAAAERWWLEFACPKKRAHDEAVLAAAGA
ncbi:MAG: serine/threonine protein kinase [Planctomycetales bacterium]|nr:serine/threonine protein kinase [Planctomycetales bacterium]